MDWVSSPEAWIALLTPHPTTGCWREEAFRDSMSFLGASALSFKAAMKQLIAAAVASTCLLVAQDAPRPKNTYHSSGGASAVPRLVSPEVRLDRTIVFRLRAPEAALAVRG